MNAVTGGALTAGDKGKPVIISAGGFYMQGATATLLVAPNHQQGGPLALTPLTISEDGLLATYTTTGTDFTEGGPWIFQLQVLTADNELLTSQSGDVYIFPRL